MSYAISSNPNVWGPGYWNLYHTLAYDARTTEAFDNFMKQFKFSCNRLPCGLCRDSAVAYIRDNPPDNYRFHMLEGSRRNIGAFYYVWEFHNWVNRKKGRPEVPFEVAYNTYKSQACPPHCREADDGSCYCELR